MGTGAANVLFVGRGGDGCGGAVGGQLKAGGDTFEGIDGGIGGDDGSGEGIDGGVGDDGSAEGGGGLGPEEKISTSQTSMDPADPAVLIRSNSACSAFRSCIPKRLRWDPSQ